INVHGANRFPVKVGDWRNLEIGRNTFIHRSVPQRFIEEWTAFVARGHPMGLVTAPMCLAPFTWAEFFKPPDLTGIERRPVESALKYGLRDGFMCPIGGRWVVAFWSPRLLGRGFTQQTRGLLYMAANAAAVRLEQLIGPDINRAGSRVSLTLRELSVLRQA